jgi:hypothetical protein
MSEPKSGYKFIIDEDGIVINRANPYTRLEPKDIEKEMKALESLSLKCGRPLPVLLDVSGLIKMGKTARRLVSGFRFHDFVSAGALVARSDIAYLIGGFTLQGISTVVPLKLFKETTEARAWLLEQMRTAQNRPDS